MSVGMPSREFADARGIRWRVWSTIPAAGTVLSADFAAGWLTFESAAELRRLAPIPAQWLDATAERLDLMCRAANVVPRHTGPMARVNADALEDGPPQDRA